MSRDPKKDREQKIQGYVAPYYKWVLQRLVDLGFEGVSLNDAVSNIVQRWLDERAGEHREFGITQESWLDARRAGPRAVESAGRKPTAKLFRFERPESTEPEGDTGDPMKVAL